jgi:hypothetical protein
MSRIFTFGCSFTEYRWPTWADIILYGNVGYNCGVSGGGFDSILYRLMEVDRKFKLTSDDKVIIVFTTPLRWDIITNYSWSTHGQILNSQFKKYENKLYSLEGLIFKSFYNIKIIHDFLENKKINYVFGSVNDLFLDLGNYFEKIDIIEETNELINYVKNNVEIKLLNFSKYTSSYKTGWTTTKKYIDNNSEYHPRPITYYSWVNDILVKEIDVDIKITKEQILEIEKHIDSMEYVSQSHEIKNIFPDFFEHRLSYSIYIKDKTN